MARTKKKAARTRELANLYEIPLDQLTAAADNPRGPVEGMDDLAGLAASIKQAGVVEPLVVVPTDGQPGWTIVAGHRRAAAAALAGLDTVPCVVHTLTDEQRRAVMLIENLQRKDLSPIEEGRGYQQLIAHHGWSQRKLAAALGVSQSHISKRLKLLGLPDDVLARIGAEKDGLTVEEALALTKLVDHPDRIVKALKETAKASWVTVDQAVQRELADLEVQDRADQARALAADRGLVVVDKFDNMFPYGVTDDELRSRETAIRLGVVERRRNVDGHELMSCHAFGIAPRGAATPEDALVAVCTDPASHPARIADDTGETEEQRAYRLEREAQQAAYDQRRTFMKGLLADGLDLEDVDVLRHVLLQLLAAALDLDPRLVWDLLDLPTDEQPEERMWNDGGPSELVQYATRGDRQLVTCAIATALQVGDPGSGFGGRLDHEFVTGLEWLAARGYQLAPCEQEAVDTYRAPKNLLDDGEAAA